MLDQPWITETSVQLTAAIRLTIPRQEIRNVMGPGIAELMAAVASQGIVPAGPVFSHHLRMDPHTFDFEIGVPVTTAVFAAGRVRPSQLPATTVARTVYRGPYEGLGPAWAEFEAWIVAEAHAPAPNLWECYVTRGAYLQAAWVEGRPEASMWTGLKIKGRRRIPLRTFRCEACGYLESYAPSL